MGIAVMLYPKVGKIWNAGRQSRVVDGYERSVEKLDVRKEEEMIAQTRAYNVMLLEQNNPVPNDKNADSYGALLNMTSDGDGISGNSGNPGETSDLPWNW